MDVNVTPAGIERGIWILSHLLRRPVGHIDQIVGAEFVIRPIQGFRLSAIKSGPYPTVDAALSGIETHTRGQCRLSRGS